VSETEQIGVILFTCSSVVSVIAVTVAFFLRRARRAAEKKGNVR
jgi:hypothetical protein